MNVTVKLPDALYTEARHRAVDEGLSLSAWLARLIEREAGLPVLPASDNILDWIGDERLADGELDITVSRDVPGEISW